MDVLKHISRPMPTYMRLKKHELLDFKSKLEEMWKILYLSMVRSLMYAMVYITLNIVFVVAIVK